MRHAPCVVRRRLRLSVGTLSSPKVRRRAKAPLDSIPLGNRTEEPRIYKRRLGPKPPKNKKKLTLSPAENQDLAKLVQAFKQHALFVHFAPAAANKAPNNQFPVCSQ